MSYRGRANGTTNGSLARAGRILVVDDEEFVRYVLKEMLVTADYDVATADNGRQAMLLFMRERFDLIIADIVMPEMDGIEVLRAVKEIDSAMPVILISGYPSAETAVRVTEMGAAEYITKPFNTDMLKLTVAKVLEKANPQPRESEQSHGAAAIDGATGAQNFEMLFASLESELARSEWRGRLCSLIVLKLDVDGRSSEKTLLRAFTELLKLEMPPDATLGRTASREFAVVLPETGGGEAMALAETAHRKTAAELTLSFAVASYPSDGSDPSALFERARTALQRTSP